MGQEIKHTNNKGGRPKKLQKRNIALTVKCTTSEQLVIVSKACTAQLTVSEYLRTVGIKGKVDSRTRALPKEVLLFTATLNHLAANINQIAKRLNTYNQLTAVEMMELRILSNQMKQLATDIKNYLK